MFRTRTDAESTLSQRSLRSPLIAAPLWLWTISFVAAQSEAATAVSTPTQTEAADRIPQVGVCGAPLTPNALNDGNASFPEFQHQAEDPIDILRSLGRPSGFRKLVIND
jgi:hypothetical protein